MQQEHEPCLKALLQGRQARHSAEAAAESLQQRLQLAQDEAARGRLELASARDDAQALRLRLEEVSTVIFGTRGAPVQKSLLVRRWISPLQQIAKPIVSRAVRTL